MSESVSTLIKPARGAMILSGGLTGCGAVLSVIPFVSLTNIAAILLDEEGSQGRFSSPWSWAIVLIITLVTSQVMYLMGLRVTHIAEAKLRHHLRLRLVDALSKLPLGRVSQIPPGQMRKMVCDDTAAIHTLVAHVPGDATNALVTALAGIVYLFWVNWQMAIALASIWVLLLLAISLTSLRGYNGLTQEFGEAQTRLSAETVEMLQGMKEIKNFQATDTTRTRFNTAREHFSRISFRWVRQSGTGMGLISAVLRPATTFATVAVLAVVFASQGWVPLSACLAFFLLAPTIPEGATVLVGLAQHIYESRLAATTTAQVLSEPQMPEGKVNSGPGPNPGAVTLNDVTFSYEVGTQVLRNVSLIALPGTVTALVGPSGGGKSTVARVIARFYDVDSGTVTVSGHDVRDATFSWLYSQLSIVLQESVLTHDSVFDNISQAKPGASLGEVQKAARAACIHERIMQLPNGYDTILGDPGGFLSGGEKQRVSLARAYLQHAPILLLDEATAQSDPQSERDIHQALSQLSKQRTVIIIAHRLSTIRDADRIAFIDKGTIVEQGTHEELMAMNGRYAAMWRAQDLGALTGVVPGEPLSLGEMKEN